MATLRSIVQQDPSQVLTGLPAVNAELAQRFLPQFLRGLLVGTVAVILMVALAFRSWKLSTLALLPTAIGLVWTAGLLGLARVELDLFAVFTVVTFVGIGVDYGIHLVHHYHEHQRCATRGGRTCAGYSRRGAHDAARLRHARDVDLPATPIDRSRVRDQCRRSRGGVGPGAPGPPGMEAQVRVRPIAIIPAFDEERSIGAVVAGVLRYVEHVIVVDDGSRDGTAAVARAAGAVVVVHGSNRGKGCALRSGIARAMESDTWTHLLTHGRRHAAPAA